MIPDPYMFRLFRDEMGSCETIICKNYKILRGSLYYKAGVLLISTFYILLDTGEEIFAHCLTELCKHKVEPIHI